MKFEDMSSFVVYDIALNMQINIILKLVFQKKY